MKSCSFKSERDINGSGTCPKTLLKSKGMDFNCIILGIFADVLSPICVRACVRVLSVYLHVGVCVMVAHVWFQLANEVNPRSFQALAASEALYTSVFFKPWRRCDKSGNGSARFSQNIKFNVLSLVNFAMD